MQGKLELDLTIRNSAQPDGSVRYCYVDANGDESPTLRVHAGDLVVLHLNNALTAAPDSTVASHHHGTALQDPCTRGTMSAVSTNLHFHGLTIPAKCHSDEVLRTSIAPDDPPFEYRFRIPASQPPGLYWYHPHMHGFSKTQVLGGASGALIVEGTENIEAQISGLPERVLVIRDQDLLHPNAPPSMSEPPVPKFLRDNDGDTANTGTGFGKPAKDLSINFVPVPYPNYEPAVLAMKPGEKQLWRVLNASAITYLNLSVLLNRHPQPLGLVAIDGAPVNLFKRVGELRSETHLGVPPGGRVEFIVTGPPAGTTEAFVTHTVDTGPGGENDPNRPLALIEAKADAPEPRLKIADAIATSSPSSDAWPGAVTPVRVRRFYFSEKLDDPNNPASASEFYITEEGRTPQMFDMTSTTPNVQVKQGTVEDWIIENRSNELHAFHIHQLHFVLLDYSGTPVNETFLRDTVNVPYYNGHDLTYPSVRLRMDFRDPAIVGTFVYHCHLLEHEDRGMMGTIEVLPADRK